MIAATSDQPPPSQDTVVSEGEDMDLVNPLILLTLQINAKFIAPVRKVLLYLTKSNTLNELMDFYTSYHYGYQYTHDDAALTTGQTPLGGGIEATFSRRI